jgi:tRNA(Glu) U13 pseudouridine synthase TruD
MHDEFAGNSPLNLACRASFELPRGAYATVLLRALGQ